MALLLLWRAPQARPARGPSKTAAAASCGMEAADVAAETFDWLTNQPMLASAQAIASQALQYSTRGVSWPPMLLGSSMRSRSCPASASTTSGVSSRRRSISGPCASSSACTARARSGALARTGETRFCIRHFLGFASVDYSGPDHTCSKLACGPFRQACRGGPAPCRSDSTCRIPARSPASPT